MWIRRTGVLLVLAVLALLAAVVFGGYRIRDAYGNVVLGWNAERARLQLLERPSLARDGPHVFATAAGYDVIDTVPRDRGWQLRTRALPAVPPPVLTVQVDNPARTRFDVILRPAPAPVDADHPANPSRLLMVSDMEGEFDRFVALMRSQGVIDEGMHWSYGDGHVVLVGDFVDRGKQMVPLLWLIYRLDDEAARAGGRLHYVLGNHEQLGIAGRTKYWPRHLVATAQALGEDGHRRLFAQESVLGAWLRSKPVIARVGDHLFVHGGISQAFMDTRLDVAGANAVARRHLDVEVKSLPAQARPVLGRSGVTWYRGMALTEGPKYIEEADPLAHLRQVTARFGVKRVAIGHSLVPDIVLEQEGMLLRLDIHHARQLPQAALYEAGTLWRVDAEGRKQRLDVTGDDDGASGSAPPAPDA
jgi:hypothetical protein